MKSIACFIIGMMIGVFIAFYIGAMFNFMPFLSDDLVISAIGFCTLIVSVVVAICTCIIIKKIENKKE